uniref:Butyrophilin subfamily 1 member A1-like n=1 Tax=Pelodiscus sinensis TaxID=13735 RepID=K7F8I5_PELSI|nr:butyrophilin subfamily 1 member A1-like [Pelodiscus sinensis]|eukprot:XP_006110800.1 butyrophilin subfamily 1 member A1-like [Pelodiscus sinensis]
METPREGEDTLPSALETRRGESPSAYTPATVTLDPDTAHPQLTLSEDGKHVRQADTRQRLPSTPERFDPVFCMLGREGFTSGRHCWEVEVGDGRHWAVGVARESINREDWNSQNPSGRIWAVEQWGDQFWALTHPATLLPLSKVPSRIRVCLDCDQRQVTFINAANEATIFTFPAGSVSEQSIQPWFRVGLGSQLSLCP